MEILRGSAVMQRDSYIGKGGDNRVIMQVTQVPLEVFFFFRSPTYLVPQSVATTILFCAL